MWTLEILKDFLDVLCPASFPSTMEGLFSFSYVVMLHSRLQGAKVFHFVKTKTLSNVLCRLKKIDEVVSFGLKQPKFK